jgi:hypothetical protein
MRSKKSPSLIQRRRALQKSRRCPTLPHNHPCSTIGPEGLPFCVRDEDRRRSSSDGAELPRKIGSRRTGANLTSQILPAEPEA